MVAISIMIEGQQGLTWPRWQRLAAEVEALGFAGLFRSDHFTDPEPPGQDSLEIVISLRTWPRPPSASTSARWSRPSRSATRSCWPARPPPSTT